LWDGWYTGLFYQKDDNPAVIADVHTNPSNDPASALYSPRVLHAATGPVVAEFLIVETDEGAAIYVDPAFTYFEVVTEGDSRRPPERLNDDQWRARLQQTNQYPSAPAWSRGFRLPVQSWMPFLLLPEKTTIDASTVAPKRSIFLPLVQQ
jgi:hypothetical protein